MNTGETAQNERPDTISSRRKAVERVITSVSQKLDEPISVEDMARMAYLSPFHFNRVFHQVTGLPPAQFLYALRLEAAKHLLLTSEMRVTEICFAVGYNSLGTFTTRFTELVGLSPSAFRRLGKQIRAFDWARFFREGWQAFEGKSAKPCLTGKVLAPPDFEGLIFVGLFEQMIPQSRPVAGTLLTRGGSFCLDFVSEGEFYLLVAALPRAEDALEYLLPDFSKLLVGVGKTALQIQNARTQNIRIELRPVEVTDPPILLALPSLLANAMTRLQLATGDKSEI